MGLGTQQRNDAKPGRNCCGGLQVGRGFPAGDEVWAGHWRIVGVLGNGIQANQGLRGGLIYKSIPIHEVMVTSFSVPKSSHSYKAQTYLHLSKGGFFAENSHWTLPSQAHSEGIIPSYPASYPNRGHQYKHKTFKPTFVLSTRYSGIKM